MALNFGVMFNFLTRKRSIGFVFALLLVHKTYSSPHSSLEKLDTSESLKQDISTNEIGQSEDEAKKQVSISNEKLKEIWNLTSQKTLKDGSPVIAVLVIACNRITVKRCLDQLIELRPNGKQFPIVVSQDCGHNETAEVIKSYGDQLFYIQHPDLSNIDYYEGIKVENNHYKVARHYRWALNQIFNEFLFDTAIIVEDDLDVAPDFFEYFMGTYPLLQSDDSLWCVSAWNDNGKPELVDEHDSNLLYRSDFFPGLGWMLTRSLWHELAPEWPFTNWDDWMRVPKIRNGRACIRPELSRTYTFGKQGTSGGQFFDSHLQHIKLNEKPVLFSKMNLTYLLKENYDPEFFESVNAATVISPSELESGDINMTGPFKILYDSPETFGNIADMFGLMREYRGGIPRTSYYGVVSFFYANKRVFLAKEENYDGQDVMWN